MMTSHEHSLNYRLLRIANDAFGLSPTQLNHEQKHQAEQVAARELLIEQAVLNSPEARQVMVPESEVDHALEQITGRYDDDAAFRSALEENTLDVDSLREAVQQGLRVEAVLDFVCRDVEPVDETEATLFYYLHRDRFMQPERRTARHILVTINEDFSENSRASANARILQIAKRLQKQPKRFEEQALKHSECPTGLHGGQLGTVGRGTLFPELDEVLFSMKVGEISPVVETEIGFHILVCDAIDPPHRVSLEEALPKLKDQLTQRKITQRRKRWVREILSA